MDMQNRIARDRQADRINQLHKRCHARFLDAAYAFRLARDTVAKLPPDHIARPELLQLMDKCAGKMERLYARCVELGRAYVATVVPAEVRNA